LLAGIYIRLINITDREVIFDESWVAFSVRQANVTDMLRTIKTTPLLFNFLVFFVNKIFPEGELSLRIVPFVFGVLGLPLIYHVSKRVTKSQTVGFISMILLAFNSRHVNYSKDLKQYTCDIFFTLLILLLSEFIITSRKKISIRETVIGVLVIVVSCLFSYPTAFLVITVFPILFNKFLSHKKDLLRLSTSYVIGFLVLGIYYIIFAKDQMGDANLLDFWVLEQAFPPVDTVGNVLIWLSSNLQDFLVSYPFGENMNFIWLLLVIPLLLKLTFPIKRVYYYYLGVLALLLIASFFKKYVFLGNRVTLFTLPFVLIIISVGIGEFIKIAKSKTVGLFLSCSVILLLFSPYFKETARREGVRYYNAWPEARQYIEGNYEAGYVVLNFNLADELWWYHLGDICDGKNCDAEYKRTYDQLIESTNGTRKPYIIVMRQPFEASLSRRFHKQRKMLLIYFQEDWIIQEKFEKSHAYIYKIVPNSDQV